MVALNLKERFTNGELDLSSCGLKEIPVEVASLKRVTSLNISNNKLSSVGKIIGNLTHLNKLDLSKNALKGLPGNIGNLTNLKHLNLSHNQLTTLPTNLGNLKNLKYLDVKNNNLPQKFADLVGACQNEVQCQQAAKNVLKAFSSQGDADKKKKSNSEQESKYKKNDKKSQNGSLNQAKQKDKDRKSQKQSKGILGTIFGMLFSLLKTLILSVLVIGVGVYVLSFYDENRFKAIKSQFYPHWHSAVTRVLSEEQSAHLESVLLMAGNNINQTVVKARDLVTLKSKQFYTYVTTDETIRQYVEYTKSQARELWAKVSSSGGGEQKAKS